MNNTPSSPSEIKQHYAHLAYELGIASNAAEEIANKDNIFIAMQFAAQNNDDKYYNEAIKLLTSIDRVGKYYAKVYLDAFIENPYRKINWSVFKELEKYKDVNHWSNNTLYKLAREIDDLDKIWDLYLANKDKISFNIVKQVYENTTKDEDELKAQKILYFMQYNLLVDNENNENILTMPLFNINKLLNNHYNLFSILDDKVMLTKTAVDYKIILNYFKENKNKEVIFETFNVDDSGFGEDQLKATKELINKKTLLLTGFAGTGKTYMLDKFISSLDSDKLVYGCSLAGKAVKNFKNSLSEKSLNKTKTSTIAGLKFIKKNRDLLKKSDVIIIDEISMLSLHDLAFIIENIKKESKLFLIGDVNQLPAIQLDVLNWLLDDKLINRVTLDIPKRQDKNSGIFNDSMEIIKGNIPKFNTEESQLLSGATTLQEILNDNKNADVILVGKNEIKDMINNIKVEEIANKKDGHNVFEGEAFKKLVRYHEGEKIMIGKNNVSTGLMNGDIFTIDNNGFLIGEDNKPAETNGQNILIGNKINISKGLSNFTQKANTGILLDLSAHGVTSAFAITTHKSQGSTMDNGVTILPTGIMGTRNLLYTAITRFKKSHKLYILNENDLINAIDKTVQYEKLDKKYQDLLEKQTPIK